MNQRKFASCNTWSIPGDVSALRQPDTRRVAPETFPVIIPRDENLRAHGLGDIFHQRQQTMGRRAGDDLQIPRVLERPERADQIALPAFEVLAAAIPQSLAVKVGRILRPAPAAYALRFLLGQDQRAVEVTQVTLA